MSSSGATWGDRSLSATRVCSAFTRPSLRQAGAPGSSWAARVFLLTERGPGGRGLSPSSPRQSSAPDGSRSAEVESDASELLRGALQGLGDLVVYCDVDCGTAQALAATQG